MTKPLSLWTAQVSRLRDSLAVWETLLSAEERARAARFHRIEDRERSVLAHAMKRILLSRTLGSDPTSLRFGINPFGKPQLTPMPCPPLFFNLAHSSDYVLLALSNVGAVGVDLERHRENIEPLELGRTTFSPFEYEALLTTPEAQQRQHFFDLWTGKEAVLKARGFGLSLDLKSFDLEFNQAEMILRETRDSPEEAHKWRIKPIKLEVGYSAAVAYPVEIESIEIHNFTSSS